MEKITEDTEDLVVFEGTSEMKGNIFWSELEGTKPDGWDVSPVVITGGGGTVCTTRRYEWNEKDKWNTIRPQQAEAPTPDMQ